jgi:hypothetical protein
MSTPLLADTAFAHLQKLKVKVLPIKPVPQPSAGSAWNVGELALVYVEITNTTGLPLRDLYVKTMLFGSAAQYQPAWSWDGNGGLTGDLEPLENWTNYVAFLKAVSPGQITILVNVCAEVVPYVSFWPAYRTEQVYPT